MNKKQLQDLREGLVDALHRRMRAGGFDANAEHMALLLGGLLQLVDHALEKEPKKPAKK